MGEVLRVLASSGGGATTRAVVGWNESAVENAARLWLHGISEATPDSVLHTVVLLDAFAGCDPDIVSRALDVPARQAAILIDLARDSGLVVGPDFVLPLAREVIDKHLGKDKILHLRHRLLRALLLLGRLPVHAAQALAVDITDDTLAEFLVGTAQRESAENPALACALFDSARKAGARVRPFALSWADAAGRSGDFGTALRIADEFAGRLDATAEDTTAALRVTAAVYAAQGATDRAAELFQWLGPDRVGDGAPVAAVALLLTGRPGEAQSMLDVARALPPTTFTVGMVMVAHGLLQSLADSAAAAASTLARAASVLAPIAYHRLGIGHPAAVAAAVAVHGGLLAQAQRVLDEALASPARPVGGEVSLLLWRSWVAMVANDVPRAQQFLVAAKSQPSSGSHRDAVVELGLRAGLARRAGDLAEWERVWRQCPAVLAAGTVDLLCIAPLGELWLAAARFQAIAWAAPHMRALSTILGQAGTPPLWSALFHWFGVRAAFIASDAAVLTTHATALGALSSRCAAAASLTSAGRAWVNMLRGNPDVAAIEGAAAGLCRIGLAWDAATLAGEAALRSAAPQDAATLLRLARQCRQVQVFDEIPAVDAPVGREATARKGAAGSGGVLTEREEEVANLVTQGIAYKDIGRQLFISAKTVEHHVARIKNRVGATSRAELLAALRAMGFPQVAQP